jgi:hypothetical protein
MIMQRWVLLTHFLVCFVICLIWPCLDQAMAGNCKISAAEKTALLALPYQEFDQTLGEGWRKYADRGCYRQTAPIVDQYRTMNQRDLLDWQVRILTWHAGQIYAFCDEYGLARLRFQNSFDPKEPNDTPILWNDYVHATLAFLDKDMETLQKHREAIASGPVFNGIRYNLAVVDGFIRCFNRPYSVAYSDKCARP